MRKRAAEAGLEPFALLTVARDSCLFTWSYIKDEPGVAQGAQVRLISSMHAGRHAGVCGVSI